MSSLQPEISIIVAVFNGGKTLQQCINSVAGQTYAHKQLIIIDGDSTDNTLELIKQNSNIIDYFISEKDSGIYDAWNKGLTQIRGQWVCFLGADDYFYDNQVLEKMINNIQHAPLDSLIIYGQVALVDDYGNLQGLLGEDWSLIKHQFKKIMCIPHPAVFHHFDFFERFGNFNTTFKIAGDYEMLLRGLKDKDAYSVMDLIMVAMRVGGVSSKPENAINSFKEMQMAQRMHGQGGINTILYSKILKEYFRIALWKLLGEKYSKKTLDFMRRIRGLEPYWERIG